MTAITGWVRTPWGLAAGMLCCSALAWELKETLGGFVRPVLSAIESWREGARDRRDRVLADRSGTKPPTWEETFETAIALLVVVSNYALLYVSLQVVSGGWALVDAPTALVILLAEAYSGSKAFRALDEGRASARGVAAGAVFMALGLAEAALGWTRAHAAFSASLLAASGEAGQSATASGPTLVGAIAALLGLALPVVLGLTGDSLPNGVGFVLERWVRNGRALLPALSARLAAAALFAFASTVYALTFVLWVLALPVSLLIRVLKALFGPPSEPPAAAGGRRVASALLPLLLTAALPGRTSAGQVHYTWILDGSGSFAPYRDRAVEVLRGKLERLEPGASLTVLLIGGDARDARRIAGHFQLRRLRHGLDVEGLRANKEAKGRFAAEALIVRADAGRSDVWGTIDMALYELQRLPDEDRKVLCILSDMQDTSRRPPAAGSLPKIARLQVWVGFAAPAKGESTEAFFHRLSAIRGAFGGYERSEVLLPESSDYSRMPPTRAGWKDVAEDAKWWLKSLSKAR